jgi:hypothetical protein
MADDLAKRDGNWAKNVLVLDFDTEEFRHLFTLESGAFKSIVLSGLMVWDATAGEWVKMVQPSITLNADDLTVTMGDVEKLLAGNYWKDMRLEYSGDDLIYEGRHTVHKTAEATATWHIWKMTYVSNKMTRREGPLVGSWTGRAALSWG